ncbi:PREDICTED: BTB/POZ domain-containing protein POB1-like isoform X1 [Ipomoea nil]|uniref:BTB/POZ domain-containing protein POB1-like isoform X1 n=2 Tax=Ipomoea nil TaxID=35883 RepID=UPI000901A9DA|nr:PREDICTED: BTB/POZ domain-containing protein POB1-like isoform X1 [Ipomoea nil]
MKNQNSELFDQRPIMDFDFSPSSHRGSASDANFAFAFNDSNFSDRTLRIEILPDLPGSKTGGESFSSVVDWARKRKRRREEINKDNPVDELMRREEQGLNCNVLDTEDGPVYDEEAVAMVEETPSRTGIMINDPVAEATEGNDPSLNTNSSNVLHVKTIHISSPILAAKSPFFYKLFSNGMSESDQRHVTLRIHASEEAALMDLLNFMYSNTLSTTTPSGLLDVLMAADKFEVASCMRYCSRVLRDLPMTCESALLYLDLPSSVLIAAAVQSLTDAAKKFLAGRFKDITKHQEEVMNLPLAGIEAVLSSDSLQITSEDAVYDFLLKWARIHYPNLVDRREILSSRIYRLIRFPFMSCRKLKKVLNCTEFYPDLISKLVLEALFFKASYRQRSMAVDEANVMYHRFLERAYKYRPVKVLEFESPRQQCIVYLDLKREECSNLFPAGRVYSQAFHLGGQGFFLSAHCNMDQQNSFHCFGLFLGMQEKGSVSFAVEYEFAARTKPGEEYVGKYKGNYKFTGGKAVGYRNLFSIPWPAFIADDSIYFINGVLHLRAELTIRPNDLLGD